MQTSENRLINKQEEENKQTKRATQKGTQKRIIDKQKEEKKPTKRGSQANTTNVI